MEKRKYKWLLTAYLLSCFLFSNQILAQGCAVQAGQDATYCLDDGTFDLEGSFMGDLTQFEWSGPTGFTILTPNSTNTTVQFLAPPTVAGDYEFYFGGFCNGIWEQDTVVIELVEVQTPEIFWEGLPEDGPITVCRDVTLTGTPPMPGTNESAQWLIVENFNLSNWTPTISNNGTQFHFQFNNGVASTGCSYFTFIYEIDNNGCKRQDTIEVTFIKATQPVNIIAPYDGAQICGDTVQMVGTAVACMGSGQFTFTSTPNGILPTLLGTADNPNHRETYDFNASGTGYYTVQYSTDLADPCIDDVVESTFFICVTNLTFGDTRVDDLFCDGLPSSGTLTNPNPAIAAGCDPQPWVSVPGPPAVIISGNTYTITDPDLEEVYFYQSADCQQCDLPDGGTVLCWPRHYYYIWAGPEIDLDADTVLLSCGGDLQFQPSQYYDIGPGGSAAYEVIASDAPLPCAQVGETGTAGNFENLSCEGTYTFRVRGVHIGDNGVICEDSVDFTVIVQTLDPPCAGVQSDICLGDTIYLDGCDPSGPADIFWEQIDSNPPVDWLTSQDIQDPVFIPTTIGTYMFEYSFSKNADCYLADTLTFNVDSCGCDITPRAWLDWIRCRYDQECAEVYDFQIAVFDPDQCHTVDEIVMSQGTVVLNGVFYVGSTLFINGTLFSAGPEELVCAEISFSNTLKECPSLCDIELCFETPRCVCRVSNLNTNKVPECIKPHQSYCLEVSFDYCGPEGPMNFISGLGTSPGLVVATFFNQATGDNTVLEGHNVWTLCFSFFGPCAEELIFEYIGEMENAKCAVRDEILLTCCCDENEWTFTNIECFTSHGQTGYSYTLVIDNAEVCGNFTLTTNGNEPSLYGWQYVDGDLVINGSVFGLSSPGSLCVDIDFENEDCCDVTACTKLPCCCQVAPVVNVLDIQCVQDPAGNISYDFTIDVGNPNGWAEDYDLTVSCGDVTSFWVPEGNSIIVSGTISNVTANPGDECCFDFDFANCNLCDVTECVDLPPCECVEDVTVVYPECVEPGVPFCVTYNFNYYGPPVSGVYSWWYIATASSSPGWSMISPGDMEDVPIAFGANSVEVCLVYEGDCLEDGIDLVVRGDMFTEENGLCCQLRDEQTLRCCCSCELDIVYCFDEEELSTIIRDILSKESRTQEDELLKEWARKYQERTSPCEGEVDCCPICQAPDYQGLIRVDVNCPNGIPDGIQYLWNTGATGNQIIGTYPGTYSVTVTDPLYDCEYTVEEEIICDQIEGLQLGSDRSVKDKTQAESIQSQLFFRPNPANDRVWIRSSDLKGNQFVLVSQYGQVVFTADHIETDVLQIDISDFKEGIYYGVIRKDAGQEWITKKLVIMH